MTETQGRTPSQRLEGDRLRDWFAHRGWTADVGGARAFVDECVVGTVTVRRIWHAPMTLTRLREHSGVTAILQVDGEADSTLGGGRTERLRPFSSLVFAGDALVGLMSTSAVARMEVVLASSSSTASRSPVILAGHSGAPSAPWSMLASVINALAEAKAPVRRSSMPLIGRSCESLVAALRLELHSVAPRARVIEQPTRAGEVYADALEVIRRRAVDPAFGVGELADELGISRRHVGRVFSQWSSSPSAAIRQERIMLARASAAEAPDEAFAEIARRAGFPTARTLKAALRTTPDDFAS